MKTLLKIVVVGAVLLFSAEAFAADKSNQPGVYGRRARIVCLTKDMQTRTECSLYNMFSGTIVGAGVIGGLEVRTTYTIELKTKDLNITVDVPVEDIELIK